MEDNIIQAAELLFQRELLIVTVIVNNGHSLSLTCMGGGI